MNDPSVSERGSQNCINWFPWIYKESFNVYKFWAQSEFCGVPLQRQLSPIASIASVSDIPDEQLVLSRFPYCSSSQNLLCFDRTPAGNTRSWTMLNEYLKSEISVQPRYRSDLPRKFYVSLTWNSSRLKFCWREAQDGGKSWTGHHFYNS